MYTATAPPAYPELENVKIDGAHHYAANGMNASINVPIQMQPQPQPQLQTVNQFSSIPPTQTAVISRESINLS